LERRTSSQVHAFESNVEMASLGPTGVCGPTCRMYLPLIYISIFIICLAQFIGFTIWLKRNRRRAQQWADKNAAKRTILPIYDWVLYWEIFYILVRAGYIWVIQQQFTAYVWGTTIVFCASKISQYFVVSYLVQSRMGWAAVCRAVGFSVWLFSITVVLHVKNRLWEYLLDLAIFMSVLCYAYSQAKTGRYGWFFWYVTYLIGLSLVAATIFGELVEVSLPVRLWCLVLSDFCRVAVHPGFLLLLLLADSQWWRSLSDSIIRMGVRPSSSLRRIGSSLKRSRNSERSSSRRSYSSMEISDTLPLTTVQETLRTHLNLIDYCSLDFYSVEYLDRGSKGEVRRCKWKAHGDRVGRDVALKSFGKNDISLEEMMQVGKEAFLSARLDHVNIVKFFGICLSPPSVHLVYEYCSERSLRHVLRNPKMHLSWEQRVTFAIQAARGLRALHRQQIIHRDIKSRNLLVHFDGKQYVVKLCDFGSARLIGAESEEEDPHGELSQKDTRIRVNQSHSRRSRKKNCLLSCWREKKIKGPIGNRHESKDERYATYMTAVVGTLAYMAPELMPSEFPFTSDSIEPAAYGLSADIFSFGYVAWEILSRRLPYYALKDVRSLLHAVLSGGRPPVPLCPDRYQRLITSCWKENPSQRPTAEELVKELKIVLEESLKQKFSCPNSNDPTFEGVTFPNIHQPLIRTTSYHLSRGRASSDTRLPMGIQQTVREA